MEMPDHFVKLYRSIITSSVWLEPLPTKVVWITMLAYADANGIVFGGVPGLAHLAGVTLDQCDEALATLLAPDKRSRTKDHEGRRLEEVDGGWRILNHRRYRDFRTERQLDNARRVAEHRKRKKAAFQSITRNDVTGGNHQRKEAEVDREEETDNEPLSADADGSLPSVPVEASVSGNHELPMVIDPRSEIPKKQAKQFQAAFVREVFEHWREVMGHENARLGGDRKAKIEARLREGYTVDDMRKAIQGCKASAFHMGDNDSGKVYDELTLILRNGGDVERFQGYLSKPGNGHGTTRQSGKMSLDERNRSAAESYLRKKESGA